MKNNATISTVLPECLGQNLHSLRKAHHLTYQQLADLTGISASYLNRIEHGQRRRVNHAALKNIATALEVDISALLGMECQESDSSREDAKRFIFAQIRKIFNEPDIPPDVRLAYLQSLSKISEFLLVS